MMEKAKEQEERSNQYQSYDIFLLLSDRYQTEDDNVGYYCGTNWHKSMVSYNELISAGSILDISKYRDTCERSISILGGIAILRYIEYRMNQ